MKSPYRFWRTLALASMLATVGCITQDDLSKGALPNVGVQEASQGPSSPSPAGGGRFEAVHDRESFHFQLLSPPSGTVFLNTSRQEAGPDGVHAQAYAILVDDTTLVGEVTGISTHDYLVIRSEDPPLQVECCPRNGSFHGQGWAAREVPAGARVLDVWFMVAGWKQGSDTWVEVRLVTDQGPVVPVPLVQRATEVVLMDLRELARDDGIHVVAKGMTLLSDDARLGLVVDAPHFTFLHLVSLQGEVRVVVDAGDAWRTNVRQGTSAGAFVALPTDSFNLTMEIPESPHNIVGVVLSCACALPHEVAHFAGEWQSAR